MKRKTPILLFSLFSLIPSYSFTQTLIKDGFHLKTEINKKESHLYEIKLKKGQYAEVIFLQQGVDLDVTLLNAQRDSIGYLDSPNGKNGPEQFNLIVENTGSYYFKIEPLSPEDEGLADLPDSIYQQHIQQNQGAYSVENVRVWSAKAYQQKLKEDAARKQRAVNWFGEHACPLKTVEAGNGFEDLQFLKAILTDVKVVGLGEATHGTREFFQMKHRMLEFLVMEMGFQYFAIEASYPGCQKINDYVLYGIGTKETSLAAQGFWTWDTEEVLEMIEWMRNYNVKMPLEKRVQFLGVDVQVLALSKTEVDSFLAYADTSLHGKFSEINKIQPSRGQTSVDSSLIAKVDHLYNELLTDMILSEGRLIHVVSRAAYERAVEQLRILIQAWRAQKVRLLRQINPEMRDYYMADNLLYHTHKLPLDARLVLWAHNGHVAADPNSMVNGGLKPMGAWLREAYGDAYYSISFAFNQGGFQAVHFSETGQSQGLKGSKIGAVDEGSLGWMFAQNPQAISFLNLRQELPNELSEYFKNDVRSFELGAGFNPNLTDHSIFYRKYTDFTRNYDAIIFVETTTRARPTQAVKGRMKVE